MYIFLFLLGGCETLIGDAGQSPQLVRYYEDSWYYIRADDFTLNVGNVICHANGYGDYITHTSLDVSDLNTSIPIYPYTHNCEGIESTLCHCTAYPENYTTNMALAIECAAPGKAIYFFCM